MKGKILYRVLILICLVIATIGLFKGFSSNIWNLLIMIVNSLFIFFNYRRRPNGKIYVIGIIITLGIVILTILLKWDEIVSIICLFINAIICISFHEHYAFKKNKH